VKAIKQTVDIFGQSVFSCLQPLTAVIFVLSELLAAIAALPRSGMFLAVALETVKRSELASANSAAVRTISGRHC